MYPDSEKGIFNSTTIDMLREAVRGVENYKDILKDVINVIYKIRHQTHKKKKIIILQLEHWKISCMMRKSGGQKG